MMTRREHTAVFLAPEDSVQYVFGDEGIQQVGRRTRLVDPDPYVDIEKLMLGSVDTTAVDVAFSTWGMSCLSGDQLDRYFPRLKAVFHAAGTVGHFAAPFLERNITIVSAWRANAVAVAEYTAAQIVLGMKGYFRNVREFDGSTGSYHAAYRGHGVFGDTVGLLGAGAIGRRLIDILKRYDVEIVVWDPFLCRDEAARLGAKKVDDIREVFERAYIVSNHLADKDETHGLITGDLIRLMREGAVFINTGRGRTVDEEALIEVLLERTDLTALLDVTWPEPPGAGSRLMAMPNARVTSHIAGAIGNEVRRMSALCIEEFDRYAAGIPLKHQVTRDMFAVLA